MVADVQAAELFGSLVRRYRTVATLTQEELATRAGLSVRAVSDMERGRTRRPFLRSVRQLADALGLAPPERAQLIAAAEPAAAAGRPDHWDPGFVPPVPRQLPCGPARFTGRAEELGVLAGLAGLAGQEAGTSVVISGTAGVGKTALAVQFAHEVAARFPDGQLYVNLRGAGPTGGPVPPEEVLRGFLGAFGLRADRLPPDVPAQAALFRSILADRRVLVILDNAHDEQQVRPLLPGSAGCLTVVTSRRQLTGLAAADGARLLSLPVLSLAESLQLLAGRLGDRVEREPEAAARVSALCAGLRLALSVAAARAVADEVMPLTALADELRQENRLDALDIGDPATSIRVVLSWSYCNLSASAAAVFRLFGLQSGPDISVPAAASLAGLSAAQARAALAELAQASLLSEHSSGQYACHDLLRTYAAELAQAVDSEPARQAAIRRISDHYLHTAWSASQHLYPGRWPIEIKAAGRGVRPEGPASHEQALVCAQQAADVHAQIGDQFHQAQAQDTVGHVQQRLGDYAGAIASYQQALSLCRELGPRYYQSVTLSHLGESYAAAGDPIAATGAWREALDILVGLGHPDADELRTRLSGVSLSARPGGRR